MAQRYTTPVATRVAGGVVSSSDQNDVDDRVVQISADIGGVPGDLNTTDNSSYAAAVNELVARNAAIQFPRQVAAQGFQTKGSSITDFVLTDTGLYKGSSGGTMDVWAPIELPNGEPLSIFALFWLTNGEMTLKLNEGADALYERLDELECCELLEPDRPDVSLPAN